MQKNSIFMHAISCMFDCIYTSVGRCYQGPRFLCSDTDSLRSSVSLYLVLNANHAAFCQSFVVYNHTPLAEKRSLLWWCNVSITLRHSLLPFLIVRGSEPSSAHLQSQARQSPTKPLGQQSWVCLSPVPWVCLHGFDFYSTLILQ